MAVQHTPIPRKPQLPRHRTDADRPYTWECLMNGEQMFLEVEVEDHQYLIDLHDTQKQQDYLERIFQRRSDPMLLVNSNPTRITSTPANLGGDRGTTPAHGVTAEGTTGGRQNSW